MIEFFTIRFFNLKDFFRTVFRYWRKGRFALVDATLLLSYFLKSPYRIAREFNDSQPYGETPLVTMEAIAKAAEIGPHDVVYELGCGRGRTSFWLADWIGCKTIGIEYVPTFVDKAQKIAHFFGRDNPQFICEDILQASFSDATVIYFFGTAMQDADILRLIDRFKTLPSGVKIITISFALSEYSDEAHFPLLKTLEVAFAWGTTTAYISNVSKKS